jgi:hypothetical protein
MRGIDPGKKVAASVLIPRIPRTLRQSHVIPMTYTAGDEIRIPRIPRKGRASGMTQRSTEDATGPRSRGEELLREFLERPRQSCGRVAMRLGVNKSTVLRWSRGAEPRPACRASLEAVTGIPAASWEDPPLNS